MERFLNPAEMPLSQPVNQFESETVFGGLWRGYTSLTGPLSLLEGALTCSQLQRQDDVETVVPVNYYVNCDMLRSSSRQW